MDASSNPAGCGKPPNSSALARQQRCGTHGDYTSFQRWPGSTLWTGCPTCDREQALRMQAEEAERHRQEAEARAERVRINRLRVSGLEGRMLRSGFDNFQADAEEQRQVLEACRSFVSPLVSEDGGGLWLMGVPGTGKTHLGSAMVSHVINTERKRACIFSARELVRMLRATWDRSPDSAEGADWRPTTEDQIIDFVGTAGLFVLDEIGTGFNSSAEQTQLFDIIDLRYKHSLPTVLISNLDVGGIRTALGERSFDRLREGARVLTCTWPSHRGR